MMLPSRNGTLLLNATQNGTIRYIDEEVDQISPGWAVLLMYLMLVRQLAPSCMTLLRSGMPNSRCCPAPAVHDPRGTNGTSAVEKETQTVL